MFQWLLNLVMPTESEKDDGRISILEMLESGKRLDREAIGVLYYAKWHLDIEEPHRTRMAHVLDKGLQTNLEYLYQSNLIGTNEDTGEMWITDQGRSWLNERRRK